MSITASQMKDFMDTLEIKYQDRGIDEDGDHIFVMGFPAEEYDDADGDKLFILTIQLRERISADVSTQRENAIKSALIKAYREKDNEAIDKLEQELEDISETEREYKMLSTYIPQLYSKNIPRESLLEVINDVNGRVKCSALSIDSHGDVIYNYMLIVEDSTVTLEQFKRLLSVIFSAVERFGKLRNSRVG